MAAPSANWTMVPLRWNFVNLDGSKPTGTIRIAPYTSRFKVTGTPTDTMVLNKPIVVSLSNGAVTVSVPCTDDPDTTPTGFTYQITEDIEGIRPKVSYHIEVPASYSVTGIDVGEVAPVSSSVGLPVSLVTRAEFDELEATVAGGGGGGGGAVSSVNGDTGVVVLNADDLADGTTKKMFTATERTKLTGISSGATVNDTDANLKNRTNHTGTQVSSTISDFQEACQDAISALLASGSGISLAYNDVANTLTITNSGGAGGLDAEAVRDAIGVALIGTGLITVSVNDAADTITISTTATANSTDAVLKARANHTGTQLAATISDFASTTMSSLTYASDAETVTGSVATKVLNPANLKANHVQYLEVLVLWLVGSSAWEPRPSWARRALYSSTDDISATPPVDGQTGDIWEYLES